MNDQQTQMMINQAQIMNQPPPPHPPHPPQVMSQQPQLPPVQSQPLILNRGYVGNSNNNMNANSNNKLKPWQPLQQNPNKIGNFGVSKPRNNNNNNNNSNNWKGKKMKQSVAQGSTQGYNPPTLHELQSQNRQKTRKFYPNKKKFNNNGNNNNRFAPYAPRNTTSFIIRAKKSGGIASLVSPCPVTPAVLPTPIFSPSREVLGDMAKEEWGVDGYGSMKGLIRLRSGNEHENEHDEEEDDDANGSSESDVEEHVEVERRLDHDLSRFEMIYPNYSGSSVGDYNNVLENRVDDQDSHIAQLEEENLTLKERLFLMEREMADLRRRLLFLERQNSNHRSGVGVEDVNEEVVENESENESENGSDVRETKEENNNEDVCMEECLRDVTKKLEEKAISNKFVNDGIIAKEEAEGKIERVGDEMDAEDQSKNEENIAGNGLQEGRFDVAGEQEKCDDEQA